MTLRRRYNAFVHSALGAAILLGSCAGNVAQSDGPVAGGEANWSAPNGGADEGGYSRLTTINRDTIGGLKLEWHVDLPDEISLEATPLAIDGILYFTGSFAAVYAVDGRTGKQLWRFDPETWKRKPVTWTVNRGVAYENGRVFVAERDGRLDALDAKTGKLIWSADSIPAGMRNQSTGAPRAMNGKVIIGNGGTDGGGRGFVTAFDATTGKQLWRFFTVPGSPAENKGNPIMETAAKTWSGEWWKGEGGGGSVWNGMTFDAQLNRVYIGVGNGGPWDAEKRSPGGGDNLFLSSIVALDADTGKYVWHFQEVQRDNWDYKATPNIVMARLKINGRPQDVLLHSPTNGFFYVLDRRTGKFISAGKTTEVTWAKGIDPSTGKPNENRNVRLEKGPIEIWPGPSGGHNWQTMSFSPSAGLAYIPIQQRGVLLSRQPIDAPDAMKIGSLWKASLIKRPGDGHGFLVAWDPVSQRQIWRIQHPGFWNGGVLSTAGGVVFQGTGDGYFDAYDAASGKRLWRFNAGLGIIAAPMSYSIGNKQYVSVLVGYGGTAASIGKPASMGWKYGAQMRRLLTFAIDGPDRLPPSPGPDFGVNAVDDPKLKIDVADATAGRAIYMNCIACHGLNVQAAGGPGPDLRESGVAVSFDQLSAFLREGRPERGMPAFPNLTIAQVRALHAYIRAEARNAILHPPRGNAAAPMPTP
jgi:quinohemoprotein ethanol dehydrogenase